MINTNSTGVFLFVYLSTDCYFLITVLIFQCDFNNLCRLGLIVNERTEDTYLVCEYYIFLQEKRGVHAQV